MNAFLRSALDVIEDTVSPHPYFAGLTVPQWRKFHWRHTVHHMRQLRALAARGG